jgi:hypothetical protein
MVHFWMKAPKVPAPAASVAPVAPMVARRVAKKASAKTGNPKLTTRPQLAPVAVAKEIKVALPAPTPVADGQEIKIFWWPDPDLTNFKVIK